MADITGFIIREKLKFDKEIFYIKDINSINLFLVDTDMVLHIVDKTRSNVVKTIQLKIPKNTLAIQITDDKKIFYIEENGKSVACFDIKTETSKKVKIFANEKIKGIIISHDNKFVMLVTETNKILSYTSSDLDFFSQIKLGIKEEIKEYFLSPDSTILVLALSSNKVLIYDLLYQKLKDSFTAKAKIKGGLVYKNAIFFELENCEYGYFKYDMLKRAQIMGKSKNIYIDFCRFDTDNLTILGATKDGILNLIDLKKLNALYTIKLNLKIKDLINNENILIALGGDNILYFFDRQAQLAQALSHINEKKYDSAFECINKNTLLYLNHRLLQIINASWLNVFKQALYLLGEDKKDTADKMLSPFFEIKAKKRNYDKILTHIEDIKNFNKNLVDKNYKISYDLVTKYPFLKNSLSYTKVEMYWDKLFKKAQIDLLEDKENIDNVKKSLERFLEIEAKSNLLKNIITNYDIFVKAKESFATKHYALFDRYVEKYNFLKSTYFYLEYEKLGKNLYGKLITLDTHASQFQQVAKDLKFFPAYKAKVEMLISYGTVKDLLDKAIEQKNIKSIYHLITKYNFLSITDAYRGFINVARNDFNNFILNIKKADFSKAYEIISLYMSIEFWQHKVSMYMQYYYYKEITNLKDKKDVLRAIKCFENIFGTTLVIKNFRKIYNIKDAKDVIKSNIFGVKFNPSILEYED